MFSILKSTCTVVSCAQEHQTHITMGNKTDNNCLCCSRWMSKHKHWTHRTQHVKWTKIICIVTDVCLVWHIHPTLNHSLNNHLMMYVQCTQWTVLKYSIFPKIRNRTEYKIGYLLKAQLYDGKSRSERLCVCTVYNAHIDV